MELKPLRSFVAVVRCGSFTRAAEKLYLSQPTVSAHVRALEEELGVKLLERDTKKLSVTEKGQELYECAGRMLSLQENLLRRWSEEQRAVIRLGASTIPSSYILPEVLPAFGRLHRETYFVVDQSDSDGVAQGLRAGLFDLGLVGIRCREEGIRCVPFYRDRMVLVTPVEERFLSFKAAGETPLKALLREPIILREEGSGSRKSAGRFLESIGVPEESLNVTARVNDQESIKNLVAGGLGVSILSERAARNFVEAKRLLSFELPGETAERQLCLLYPEDMETGSPAGQFAAFVQDFYRETQRA